ncbi:PopZ family protein [Roseibium aggregatum]|uniref:PopZ family protein n=1 Tax=Roseibium aggregatum TaxID=187304 RepID=UPI003A98650A
MAQAKKADEPSMEEILASIRRIISDEDSQGAEDGESGSSEPVETPVEEEAADDMGDASEMSQDDLDKLFDMSSDDEEDLPAEDEDADDMAAAMAADAEEDEGDDVLELTEELAIPEDDAMDMVEGMAEDLDGDEGDISFAAPPMPEMAFESEPDFDPEPVMATRPVPDDLPNVPDDAPLTSQNTGEAVHAAFDNLSNMFVGSQAQTVEELVKEMLRPMLKAWLDQNLPGMVEQMVQKEIQRVTRRR